MAGKSKNKSKQDKKAKKAKGTSDSKVRRFAEELGDLAGSGASLDAMHGIVGTLEVPSGESFDAEIWLIGDLPLWRVELAGLTDSGTPLRRLVGENQPHLAKTMRDIPDGKYFLTIVATLQAPGAHFRLVATSSSDQEAKDLTTLAAKPRRSDMLPVRVG